ncbi:YhdH/YhfP family quinone oxidoreductase [Halosquirtibacter laminarini]|uniref:YhdH/YhfP family quinone oxidoreductase n=1 Tax=Halosquirtibacter laminarini TaxID=3374600 RepID=A0AC61NKA3_9BACT|nr:YhdH/YhfP family quinone oxidoreductase [Prolixibacteraceae bacterium]
MANQMNRTTPNLSPAKNTEPKANKDHKHQVNCPCGVDFRALRIFEEKGIFRTEIVHRKVHELPEGDVLIRIQYSSLNYKDVLSMKGNRGVTRHFPHTPGIDGAGVVEDSSDDRFKVGDKVIITSFDLGMNHDGALAEYVCVPADWVVALPSQMDFKAAMALGTAGFTAGLSVLRLLEGGQTPEMGPVLVTGAAGGVGSVACLILNKLGFDIIAGTSNITDSKDFITKLDVVRHIDNSVIDDRSKRALLRPMWGGAIDTVGGNVLATALKSCVYGGNVTCCGNVFSGDLETSVYPFILNGISLLGVDSQNTPMEKRVQVWNLLANEWKLDNLFDICSEISLEDVVAHSQAMMRKKGRGRILVKI